MNETEENRDERGGLCELKMSNRNFRVYNIIYMWEPKMCKLAWQLLGMLGNVLGILCNVLGMLATSSVSSACIFARSYESHIEEKPPHLLPYKL